MRELVWTKTAPGEAGWYWLRLPEGRPMMVDVMMPDPWHRHGQVWAFAEDHAALLSELIAAGAEWAGPLLPPFETGGA